MKILSFFSFILVAIIAGGCASVDTINDEDVLKKINFLIRKIANRERITAKDGLWLWGEEEISDTDGFSKIGAVITDRIYHFFEKDMRGFSMDIYVGKNCNTQKYNKQREVTWTNFTEETLVCIKIQFEDRKGEERKLCIITIPIDTFSKNSLQMGNATIGNQLLIPQSFYDENY